MAWEKMSMSNKILYKIGFKLQNCCIHNHRWESSIEVSKFAKSSHKLPSCETTTASIQILIKKKIRVKTIPDGAISHLRKQAVSNITGHFLM